MEIAANLNRCARSDTIQERNTGTGRAVGEGGRRREAHLAVETMEQFLGLNPQFIEGVKHPRCKLVRRLVELRNEFRGPRHRYAREINLPASEPELPARGPVCVQQHRAPTNGLNFALSR